MVFLFFLEKINILNEYKLFYQVLTEVKTLLQTSIFYLNLYGFLQFFRNNIVSNVLKNADINIISICFRNHLGHACIG